jgi:hypothetical protein
MRNKFLGMFSIAMLIVGLLVFSEAAHAQRRRGRRAQPLKVCGNPNVACRTNNNYEPHDLPILVPNPETVVIWESEPFYAIILKSVNARRDCNVHVPESERLEAQQFFPNHKVFATRCAEPGTLFYTNTNSNYNFMAVFAGTTRAEANRVLARVKATGRYPTANLRLMRAGFNGT